MTAKPSTSDGLNRIWASSAVDPDDVVDPDTILGGKVDTGWVEEFPPFQYMNWIQRYTTQHLTHVNEFGVGQWDAVTDYPISGVVISTVDGLMYRSIVNPNVNNEPSVSPSEWELFTQALTATETQAGVLEIATQAEADGSSDDDKIVTPLKLHNRTATETRTGIAEIATQSEANGSGDDDKIITPEKLHNRTATETRRGIAEVATTSEVATGSDDTRIITPLKLQERFFTELKLGEIIKPGDSFSTSTSGNTNVFTMGSIPIGTYKLKCFVNGNMASAATTEEARFFFSTVTNDIQFSVKAIATVTTTPEFKYSSNSALSFDNDVIIGNSTTGTNDAFFEADGIVEFESSSNLNLVCNTDGIALNIRHAIMVLERIEDIDDF